LRLSKLLLIMKNYVFWDITPYSSLNSHRRFTDTCRLHRVRQARNQHEDTRPISELDFLCKHGNTSVPLLEMPRSPSLRKDFRVSDVRVASRDCNSSVPHEMLCKVTFGAIQIQDLYITWKCLINLRQKDTLYRLYEKKTLVNFTVSDVILFL
jgi:hypothetical protein